MPFGWPDPGVNPGHQAHPSPVQPAPKSHLACSICPAVTPIRAIIAFIAGGGVFISCGRRRCGTDRDAAPRQGRDRLLTDLPESAVGHAGAMLDAIDSGCDRLLYGRCSMRMRSHRHTGCVSLVND